MTNLLLFTLNVPAWGLILWAISERRSAGTFRRDSLEVHRDKIRAELLSLDADLVGRTRALVADKRGSDQANGHESRNDPVGHNGNLLSGVGR